MKNNLSDGSISFEETKPLMQEERFPLVVMNLYEELAKIVVKDSLNIDSSDTVSITTWDHTIDVANAFAVECFKQGADAIMILWTDEYYYGLLRELSESSLGECSRICQAFTEAETATINMFGPKNPEGLKNIPPSKVNAWGEGERKSHYPPSRVRPGARLQLSARLFRFPLCWDPALMLSCLSSRSKTLSITQRSLLSTGSPTGGRKCRMR